MQRSLLNSPKTRMATLPGAKASSAFGTPMALPARAPGMVPRTGGASPAAPRAPLRVSAVASPPRPTLTRAVEKAPTDVLWDAIVIGSGMGGLATAAKLMERGAKVLVLEKYIIPGGSAGRYEKEGYVFDVGSSMMFGFGDKGETNLLTRCLASVGKTIETIPDPVQIHYHLPNGVDVRVWRNYQQWVEELQSRFPHEKEGIQGFYDECWAIFNSLNSLELKSLEEPKYLMGQLVKAPKSCLTLAYYVATNTADVARKWVTDPDLLHFIDIECFAWSTVRADLTPFINAGMVLCDRHYGGVNYPKGGIGMIPKILAEGIVERGGTVEYKANVKEIMTEGEGENMKAVGVRLADGREYRSKVVVSNATRWDTFEKMIGHDRLPHSEKLFRQRYKKSPSFFTMHLGVKAEGLPEGTFCHHILLDDWNKMEEARGTLFVSIPTVLDSSLAPPDRHIIHAFVPDFIDNWEGLPSDEYKRKKDELAQQIIKRLETIFPKLGANVDFMEVGTPRTHRKFLNREDGTYGPIPARRPMGIISMPFNTTTVEGLYCVGDSTFPGQGVNAVVFSGFGCAHRISVDLGFEEGWPVLDNGFNGLLNFVRDRS